MPQGAFRHGLVCEPVEHFIRVVDGAVGGR